MAARINAAVRRLGRWERLCLLVGAVVAVFAVVLGTGGSDSLLAQTVSNFGLCVGAITAALACLVRARSFTGRMRWGWAFIGLGVLSWGLGQSCWVYLESFLGDQVPFPSQADLGYLGMVLLTPIGLLILPSRTQRLANRVRSVLDGLLVAGSLVLMAWVFVVQRLISSGHDSALGLGVSLAYPLGDVVIVTMVVYMLALQRRHGRNFGQLALVGAGIVAFAVSDIGYAYLALVDAYASGGVTDIGWFAGFSLILLAARKPPALTETTAAHEAGDELGQPVGILLPYVAVLGALFASVLYFARTGQSGAFVTYTRSVLILLIVGRQLLTLRENRDLTRTLEARVADRTAELFASEQRFHALVQHSSDVVTVVSPEANVLYQSESIQRVFGYPAHLLTGRRLTGLIDAGSGRRLARALRQVAGRPYATTVLEISVQHRDGRLRRAEMTITNLLGDPSVGGLVLNTRDISERKELQDQLVHEAYHDALTQLANRALFSERVTEALRRREPGGEVTVLFLDLDGFKEVNDSLGHLAGDQLLVHVADRLRASVRAHDLVARFGGDEFAILVEQAPGGLGDDAALVAQRIVNVLEDPFGGETRDIHVQASIGLANAALLAAGEGANDESDGAEQLMRNADLAMYKAKSAGGGCYTVYDPQLLAGLVERLELEAALRLALERGELELHYQPTIDLATSEVIGFEALVRWWHPERGMIAPLDFIPLAEATGLIVPLGKWVLEEACRQTVEWSRAGDGRPVKMAVNVSVRQFDRAGLVETVAAVLAETGMPAGQLCLEMTESVLMSDTDDNLEQLVRLKALGVTLAIDDFGTGYSSLAYLRRFPVDTLKIDRSFVERLGMLTDDTALADTIVQLGKSLGMATVAEGIEEFGQLAALREMGCGFAQGYYFSRPVPATEAGKLLLDAARTAA
jgi:diguanylate cyclase (GGDEF)-like protein/PAS domain S-box-containing protein